MDTIDLSFAQVEAELRAAEAYLTAASGTARGGSIAAGQTEEASPYDRMRLPMAESESSFFKRPARAKAPISEERRKEILAKLSIERQAAVRSSVRTPAPGLSVASDSARQCVNAGVDEQQDGEQSRMRDVSTDEYIGRADRDHGSMGGVVYDRRSDFSTNGGAWDAHVDDCDEYEGYDDEQGDGEVFYAADVIGKSVHEHIAPRATLDLFTVGEDEDDGGVDPDRSLQRKVEPTDQHDADEFGTIVPTDGRPFPHSPGFEQGRPGIKYTTESVFAKLLARREEQYSEGGVSTVHLLSPAGSNADEARRMPGCDEDEEKHRANQLEGDIEDDHLSTKVAITTKPRSRIDVLAQPRTRVFADREKQRLMIEMEALKECTFQPVLKACRLSLPATRHAGCEAKKRQTKSVHFGTSSTSAGNAFPWLTLSPRRKRTSREAQSSRPTLIDRLNLDVSVKYEARQRLREVLEAEKMRECTFQPQINSASRRLLSRTDYKPIHERIGDLQREKVEYIQRVREELAQEEGMFTFTPQINPRSREIAEAVLCEKQVSKIRANTRKVNLDDERQLQAMLQPPPVTERLTHDAEQLAEKRVAVQAYYDALEEKSFVPSINETSSRLVEQKPEFKLDFLSRQEYFRMVEQEKLEALEDLVHHEQELRFRPDIGNAEKVLREMRPDLAQETPQQRLDRLVYHEPRRKEMVKQRRRDEEHGKLPFKPEINPVSKALVEKAKAEALSKAARRHELQRYFAGKQFRSRVAKELEQAEMAECTFRPQLISRPKVKSSSTSKLLVKKSTSVWRSDTILHTIDTQRQHRAEQLELKRNALELKELENCTFQPNVRRPPRRTVSESANKEEKPVVVRGLGRFLELKERAKRQQEERRQREEKVFNPNHAYEPRSYTVPKPFNLSETNKDSIRRRLKLREEMRAKERNECTFAPRTLEAQQRQVLRVLLKE